MGIIEESHQLIQFFRALELRSIVARLDALESCMNGRFIAKEWRIDSFEQQAAGRHAEILQAIARLADVYELKERVARIEAREKAC